MGKKEWSYILEKDYQMGLKKRIKDILPGSIVLKADPNDIQGIPDLLVLYKGKWASLEVKKSENAKHRPNQDYYVAVMDEMSFSRFIFPENEEEVLHELQQALSSSR